MFEKCLYFNSQALARTVNRIWGKAYAKYDLSPPHAFLLRLVLNKPRLRPKEISKELGIDKSTVTRFIDSLVKRGFLIRRQASSDGREQRIHPTKKAQEIHEELDATGRKLTDSAREVIGEKMLETVVRDMRKVKETFIK